MLALLATTLLAQAPDAGALVERGIQGLAAEQPTAARATLEKARDSIDPKSQPELAATLNIQLALAAGQLGDLRGESFYAGRLLVAFAGYKRDSEADGLSLREVHSHSLLIFPSFWASPGVAPCRHQPVARSQHMHVTIVNFQLKNMSHEQFLKSCEELAPAFADIPGLITKVWLSDPAKNTYGGVYTWADKSSFDSYTRTDLAKAVMGNPNFASVTVKDFAVLEAPTRVTRGLR